MSVTTGGRVEAANATVIRLDEAALVERAYRIARRAALGIAGPDSADDVAQEVAIEALRQRRSSHDPSHLDGWLYRVATRTALRHAKRDRRRREQEHRHGLLHTERRSAGTGDEVADVIALLADLPERARAAMTLRYVFDLSDRAIADALGCREATVRSLLARGRAHLRDRLDAQLPSTTASETHDARDR